MWSVNIIFSCSTFLPVLDNVLSNICPARIVDPPCGRYSYVTIYTSTNKKQQLTIFKSLELVSQKRAHQDPQDQWVLKVIQEIGDPQDQWVPLDHHSRAQADVLLDPQDPQEQPDHVDCRGQMECLVHQAWDRPASQVCMVDIILLNMVDMRSSKWLLQDRVINSRQFKLNFVRQVLNITLFVYVNQTTKYFYYL